MTPPSTTCKCLHIFEGGHIVFKPASPMWHHCQIVVTIGAGTGYLYQVNCRQRYLRQDTLRAWLGANYWEPGPQSRDEGGPGRVGAVVCEYRALLSGTFCRLGPPGGKAHLLRERGGPGRSAARGRSVGRRGGRRCDHNASAMRRGRRRRARIMPRRTSRDAVQQPLERSATTSDGRGAPGQRTTPGPAGRNRVQTAMWKCGCGRPRP